MEQKDNSTGGAENMYLAKFLTNDYQRFLTSFTIDFRLTQMKQMKST